MQDYARAILLTQIILTIILVLAAMSTASGQIAYLPANASSEEGQVVATEPTPAAPATIAVTPEVSDQPGQIVSPNPQPSAQPNPPANPNAYPQNGPSGIGTILPGIVIPQPSPQPAGPSPTPSGLPSHVPGLRALKVTRPASGETVSIGDTIYICWKASGVDRVAVQYRVPGYTWVTIKQVTARAGALRWRIPMRKVYASDHATVRVVDVSNPRNVSRPVRFRVLDRAVVGKIEDPFRITSPRSGQSFTAGTTVRITWTMPSTVRRVRIRYRPSSHHRWRVIGSTGEGVTYFTWVVPLNGEELGPDAELMLVDAANNQNVTPVVKIGATGGYSSKVPVLRPVFDVRNISGKPREMKVAMLIVPKGVKTVMLWGRGPNLNDVRLVVRKDHRPTPGQYDGMGMNTGRSQAITWSPTPGVYYVGLYSAKGFSIWQLSVMYKY